MAVGRGVYQRWFNTSHASYWWPPRERVEERNGSQDYEQLQPGESSLAFDGEDQRIHMEDGEVSKSIYVLGAGNLGNFTAHSLAGIPRPPSVTILLRRRQLQNYLEHDSSIDVTTRGVKQTRRGFQVELLLPHSQNPLPQESHEAIDTEQLFPGGLEQNHLPSSPFLDPQSVDAVEGHQPSFGLEKRNAIMENYAPRNGPPNTTSRNIGDLDAESDLKKEGVENPWSTQAEYRERRPRLKDQKDAPKFEAGVGAENSNNMILHLIVSVKAPQTVRALQYVAHRLSRDSTILFLQNGMGVVDEVNAKLFPDEKHRPTYIIGVVSHGLYSTKSFSVIHAGEGTIALGVLPRLPMDGRDRPEHLTQLAASARYLLRTMTRTPVFVAVGFPPTDLLQQQLDKLAVNCIINPLTGIIDCKNGALLSNFHFTRIMRLLLAEISLIIMNLPELKNVPNVKMRFDTIRLERLVVSIVSSTAGNTSSMLQDLRQGRQTEIDYINGYIVKRGEEMGVHCVMNYMLIHMIKGKRKIVQEQSELLPFAGVGQKI